MSCLDGQQCHETAKRNVALIILALMAVIFLILSLWSFLPARDQALPDDFSFADNDAIVGKRVFQAYNCMGCHTIVGNGAYLGPDLTNIYEEAGPAWLAAFLPSAGGWPTNAAVNVQLQNQAVQDDIGNIDIDQYRQQFAGVVERVDIRGGKKTLMPNLTLKADETAALIAFFKYTSAMNTEGWPPKPHPDRQLPVQSTVLQNAQAAQLSSIANTAVITDVSDDGAENKIDLGKKLVADFGCVACHASDDKRMIGPGWAGLADSTVELEGGASVIADTDYIAESIRQPDAKIVKSYPAGVMPSYDQNLIDDSSLDAILAYLQSL